MHFASLMDLCHLKSSELEPTHPKYKGRVVLRGEKCKMIHTEQGSSASQMTAANVMDVIARLPGCAGQAADAASAYTQVKNGRCTVIVENSSSPPRHKWPKCWSSMEDPVVSLERNLCVYPLAGSQFDGTRLGKSSKLGMPVCKPRKRTNLVCVCGRHDTGWEKHKTLAQCGKY